MNRRRVCGKGWHIDIGPGFDLSWHRTLEGHAFQGVVLLVLLSDWAPGTGGTALATGSHKWVEGQIRDAAADTASDVGSGSGSGGGLEHKELNQRCIDHMLRLARSQRVWIPLDSSTLPSGPEEAAAAAPPPPPPPASKEEAEKWPHANAADGPGYCLHQVVGRAGDVVLMHPWIIHGGSVNLSASSPRLMANGMSRIRGAGGNQVLQRTVERRQE